MSAAQPASTSPRRVVAHTRAATGFAFNAADDRYDEIRLNLRDVPNLPRLDDMHVEGFKPSLLSRLMDLFVPAP